ncbi:DNA polymerase IV [Glaciecola sp. 1036]|uniref:DNA polymerase IV n=1 Tax=Alteromonadaceae TaxID=72275 RepID=UPI003D064367
MKKFIHVDMDAFYVAVEIRDAPELADKPVAVGGRSRTRGVLSTCNYIARQYGIHSAMPTAIAVRKCPELIIVPGRMQVYKEVSQHIRSIFKRYTDLIEPLSLDEAYLDVTDTMHCNGSATLIAQEIRQCIQDELNLTASAGVAPLKFVAKVASDMNKPNGQYVVTPENLQSFIDNLPLNKIPGVGKVTFEKLKTLGWLTGKDIRELEQKDVIARFGKFGASLWRKCNAIDNRGVEVSRIRKSVGVEHTFSENLNNEQALSEYMSERLIPELKKRAKNYINENRIDKLGVKVKFADFHQTTKEQKFNSINLDIFSSLLHEAFKRGNGKSARLLGVHIGLVDAIPEDSHQLTFDLEKV